MTDSGSGNYVLLTKLADEFAARYRAGERPTLQEYIDRHPDLADDIRELFPAMVEIEQVKEDHQEAETPPAAPVLQQLGDFRIIREVGKGGMGIVYEAEQVSLGRHVALKVLPKNRLLDPKAKQRFEREAKSAAKLHHTNIVPVFGVGEQDGMPYYAMQFIQGLGLDEVLEELKQLQIGNAKTRTYLGGEVRNVGQVSNLSGDKGQVANVPVEQGQVGNLPHDRASAAEMARSLLTGEFPVAGQDDKEAAGPRIPGAGQVLITEYPVPSAPHGAEHELALASDSVLGTPYSVLGTPPPAQPGAVPPSSSSLVLPGQSRDGSKSKHGKQTYWQSVANIGVQVADALEYAHKQGVQHRDIKPSNLLLDTQGTVWVADFGLAKADDQQNLTHTGDILGTLRYMPPEAFEGKSDARSDVYSLGLTLYELLAFRPAFAERDRNRLLKQVTTEEPTRLSKLNKQVPRDLETIVHKAIDRDPSRRYGSAGALAEDLQRFKADEPILARRVNQSERLLRWCRRNPEVATLAAAFLLALVIGLIGVTLQWQRAEANAATAREKEEETASERDSVLALNDQLRRINYASQMNLAQSAWEADNVGRVVQLLEQQRPKAGEPDLRGFEWYYWQRQCHGEIRKVPIAELSDETYDSYSGISMSADGTRLATVFVDKLTDKAIVWDGTTGKELLAMPIPQGKRGYCNGVLTRDGRRLVTIWSNNLEETSRKGDIRVWDVATGREILHISSPSDYHLLSNNSLSADGARLATVSNINALRPNRRGDLTIWDCETGKSLLSVSAPGQFGWPAMSPDGTRVAVFVLDGVSKSDLLHVWDVATGKVALRIKAASGYSGVVFSPDGKLLASTVGRTEPKEIHVWDARNGNNLLTIQSAPLIFPLVFSRDGKLLAGSDMSSDRIKVWDTSTGKLRFNLTGHTRIVGALAFSQDGRNLYSAGHDGTLRVWDIAIPKESFETREPAAQEMSFGAISPDGTCVARCTSSQASSIEILDPLGNLSLTLQVPVGKSGQMAFSADNKRLGAALASKADPIFGSYEIRVWDGVSVT